MNNLKKLSLIKCELNDFPKAILELENLQSLHLWKNNIKVLPNDIFIKLSKLTTILLGDNPIEKIPNGLSLNNNLKQICFNKISSTAYPDDFCDYSFSKIWCNFSLPIIKNNNYWIIKNKEELNNLPHYLTGLFLLNTNTEDLNNLPTTLKKLILKNCQIQNLNNLPLLENLVLF